MQKEQRLEVNRSHPILNRSVKLICYLAFGIMAPFMVWFAARRPPLDANFLINTSIAGTLSALATWYMLDRFRFYAKVRPLSYVVPINLVTFGLSFSVIGLLRAPYAIPFFVGCFLATLATSYTVTALTRLDNRRHFIVPGGRISELSLRENQVIVSSLQELSSLIETNQLLGSIVSDLHFDHTPEWERLFAKAALRGIPVYHYRQISELETGQVRIDHLSENVLGSLIPNLPYMALKRVLDVLLTILALPVLIPLMLLLAVLIKLDSRGPVLFIQDRVGFRGDVFPMVKFRTMHMREVEDDPDALREDSMTKSDDDRITRIGRFLRKVRLDEIPQAWNIVKGDMSWIGPRPEAISLSEWYENEIPFYSYRHIVRPGLTGWAQVNQGHVTNLGDVTAKLRYDFYYVKNISHWLDMLIALKTIRVVLGGLGAK